MQAPFVYLGLIFAVLSGMAITLTWAGRLIGGSGQFETLLPLVTWLQALRLVPLVLVVLLGPVLPGIAALFVLVASAALFWMLLHFVKEAHGLSGLGSAFGVVIGAFLALTLLASLVLSVLAPDSLMGISNV